MIIEFECSKIKTSFKSDFQNFATNGSCKINFNINENMVELNLKKYKEKIFFDDKDTYLEISHAVDGLI